LTRKESKGIMIVLCYTRNFNNVFIPPMKTNNITEEQDKITWRRAAVIFADE